MRPPSRALPEHGAVSSEPGPARGASGVRAPAISARPPTRNITLAYTDQGGGSLRYGRGVEAGLLTYRAFLDVCLTRRAACFTRWDALALAALRGFATDAF